MKDYYEILEVSSSASSEVIEKAYKALVKKYHPDLQPIDKKQDAEDKIKVINEAYDVLSNEEKKKEYDIRLKKQKLKEEEQKYANIKNNTQNGSSNYRNNTYNNNANYQRQSSVKNPNINNNKPKSSMQKRVISKPHNFGANNYDDFDFQNEFNQNINDIYRNAYNDAYNNAYINNLKNMGYQIHYEKTFGEKIRTFFAITLSIIFLIIVSFILWHIPPIRSRLVDLYNSNDIIKLFVDIIINIFRSFFSLFS